MMLEKFRLFFRKSIEFISPYKKFLKILLIVAWVLIIVLILRAAWISRDKIMPYLLNAHFEDWWKIFLTYLAALFFAALGWSLIFRSLDGKVKSLDNILIYLLTIAGSRLPGTIWYVGGRAVIYSRLGASQTHVVSATGIELLTGFIANVFIAVILIPIGFNLPNYYLFPLIALFLLVIFLLRPSSIQKLMKQLKRPLAKEIKVRELLLWTFVRVLLVLAGGFMTYYMITMFYPLDFTQVPKVIGARAISGVAGLLTYFLPSSLGASDITMLSMLSAIIPTSLAIAIAILIRLFTSTMELLAGLLTYLLIRFSPRLRLRLLQKD